MGEFRLADRLTSMASEAVSVERRCVFTMAAYDVGVPEIAAALGQPVPEVEATYAEELSTGRDLRLLNVVRALWAAGGSGSVPAMIALMRRIERSEAA
jgi:hypothetical protein